MDLGNFAGLTCSSIDLMSHISNNQSIKQLPRFKTHLSIDSPFVFYFMRPDGRSSAAPVSSTAPKKNHLIEAAPFGRLDQMWRTTV